MDDWRKTQGGFRMDWAASQDRVTVQGDLYHGTEDQLTPPAEVVSGGNLLARWNHALAGGSALQVQTYADYVAFYVPGVASDYLHTYDLEAQHSFTWGSRQFVVWGAGERIETDDFRTVLSSTQGILVSPQQRTLEVTDLFAQDTITLTHALRMVLGTKFEKDPYTGFEALPSIRLAWQLTDANLLWLAVSSAVRAPSRVDRDFEEFAGPVQVIRSGDFQPERLVAYEVGYRAQPTQNTSISISTFYNVYTDLRSVQPSPGGALPIKFANNMAGDTSGVEAWGTYRVNAWWRFTAGANWLHESLHFQPGASPIGGIALAGDDPSYQVSIGWAMDLVRNWQWSMNLRRIAALPDPASPAYTEVDTRIGWSILPTLEVSLAGFNLLHAHHLEFGTASTPIQLGATGVETGRSIFLQLRGHF
jgi:iron complex outermembrane receptor protein